VTTDRPLRLTLCLLTLNEIEGCRHDVPNLPLEAFDEVFAVDGGSNDGTVEYLEGRGLHVFQQDMKGYNGAYICAFTRCSTDALVIYHPKGSIDPAVLLKFRLLFEQGYDLVVASRLMRGGRNEEDGRLWRPRKWFVRALGVLVALLWQRDRGMIADVLHGCRGMRRDAFFAIDPLPKGVSIDLEMVARAYRLRLRRAEFPVAEGQRRTGETHFKAWPTGRALLRYLALESRRAVRVCKAATRGHQAQDATAANVRGRVGCFDSRDPITTIRP
jgi:glycosyltransferase involved in cell wall biosynthesis